MTLPLARNAVAVQISRGHGAVNARAVRLGRRRVHAGRPAGQKLPGPRIPAKDEAQHIAGKDGSNAWQVHDHWGRLHLGVLPRGKGASQFQPAIGKSEGVQVAVAPGRQDFLSAVAVQVGEHRRGIEWTARPVPRAAGARDGRCAEQRRRGILAWFKSFEVQTGRSFSAG